jgi:dolichol-phosphate mannosyltransferase
MRRLSDTDVSPATPDFRLLDRAAVDALLNMRERARFLRGLVSWIGFSQKAVPFTSPARYGGSTKYTWRKMLGLAMDAITSFSTIPLRFVTYLGFAVSLFSFVYGVYVVWARLFTDRAVPGWASIMVMLLLLSGVQLIGLGIIGEYIGRIYEESKQRPLYIVERLLRTQPECDGVMDRAD